MDCEHPFQVLFQYFISVNIFLIFQRPWLPFGPQLARFTPPQTMSLLAQKELDSKDFWWRIARRFRSSGTLSHRYNKKILMSWQISLSVPSETDQRYYSWYLCTFWLNFISCGWIFSTGIGGGRIYLSPHPLKLSRFLTSFWSCWMLDLNLCRIDLFYM